MSLWSKILLGLVVVTTLGCLYLAANVMKANDSWRRHVKGIEQKVEKIEPENKQLREGGLRAQTRPFRLEDGPFKRDQPELEDRPGILQFESALGVVLAGRGPAWFNAQPVMTQLDPATGQVPVTLDLAKSQLIDAPESLYVFEERPKTEGGVYLGEFQVLKIEDADPNRTVTLKPVRPLSPRELEKLSKSTGPWALYGVMPADTHHLFAGLSADEKDKKIKELMPESVQREYLRDGQPKAEEDPSEDVVDGKYVRPLRDYAEIFRHTDTQIAGLRDRILAMTSDLNATKQVVQTTIDRITLREEESKKLEADKARMQAEEQVIRQHKERLEALLAEKLKDNQRLLAENLKLAEQWTAKQQDAAKKSPPLSRLPQENAVE